MSMDYDYNPQEQPKGNRNYIVTLLLAWFLGPFGAHRFYTGYTGIGVAQLLLSFFTGLGSIWALVDLIAIALNKYEDADGCELADVNPGCGMIALIVLGVSVVAIFAFMFMMFGSIS